MNRLPGLDLLRALAIVWVMLFHTGGARIGMPIRDVSKLGWMGVDLFFVLSGFLIGRQLFKLVSQNQLKISDFYISRAFRILPAYFVVLLIYFTLPFARESSDLPALWQFLTFSVNLFVDISTNTFSHVWSLCVEEHFYLVFPLLVLLLKNRCSTFKVMAVAYAIVGFGMYLRADIWLNELTSYPVYPQYVEKIYYPTYTRLDGLLAGVLLSALCVFKPDIWRMLMNHANKVLLIGLTGLACSIWLFEYRYEFSPTVYGYPLLAFSLAFIVAGASSTTSIIGRFKVPGAAILATLAYSLYLTHKSVFFVVKTHFGPELSENSYVAFMVYSAAALTVAGVLYLVIERPFLQLRTRWLNTNEAKLHKPIEHTV